MSAFKPNQLVWAKVVGFPWWPGIVLFYFPSVFIFKRLLWRARKTSPLILLEKSHSIIKK